MSEICIQVPDMGSQQVIDVEVKVNGEKQRFHYRVELIHGNLAAMSSEERIRLMRDTIENYDPSWQLYQIGAPTDTYVPIMFRQRSIS